jgi:hypothetical protein
MLLKDKQNETEENGKDLSGYWITLRTNDSGN